MRRSYVVALLLAFALGLTAGCKPEEPIVNEGSSKARSRMVAPEGVKDNKPK